MFSKDVSERVNAIASGRENDAPAMPQSPNDVLFAKALKELSQQLDTALARLERRIDDVGGLA